MQYIIKKHFESYYLKRRKNIFRRYEAVKIKHIKHLLKNTEHMNINHIAFWHSLENVQNVLTKLNNKK